MSAGCFPGRRHMRRGKVKTRGMEMERERSGGVLYINPETLGSVGVKWEVIYILSHADLTLTLSLSPSLCRCWMFNRASCHADQGSLADAHRPFHHDCYSKLAKLHLLQKILPWCNVCEMDNEEKGPNDHTERKTKGKKKRFYLSGDWKQSLSSAVTL